LQIWTFQQHNLLWMHLRNGFNMLYMDMPLFQLLYSAVMSWSSQRHKFVLQPEWILPVIGVVPALSALVSAFTSPGDKVLVQEPVYHCFLQ
jgi:bifunctional pyridoxal-dependent enzyme with beta-cystathionase and maltose regulon repressor activities